VAGEKGRGFKLVAEEIRSLSIRTAAAAKKIRKLIQDTQEAIQQGTERVRASGNSFDAVRFAAPAE
jgi:methyl-accepting chemotaxis protein